MAKVNLKSIYTSADKFTILQLLEEFVKKVDAIDFPSDEEMKQAQEDIETLQGKVETIEDTTIPGLANRLTTVEGKVDTLEITTVPALGNRLTTVEGKVNTLETTTIPALDNRVTELETTVIKKIYKHRTKFYDTFMGEVVVEWFSSSPDAAEPITDMQGADYFGVIPLLCGRCAYINTALRVFDGDTAQGTGYPTYLDAQGQQEEWVCSIRDTVEILN